jgi:hypothetical protein
MMLSFLLGLACASDEVDQAGLGAACKGADGAACDTLHGWAARQLARDMITGSPQQAWRRMQLEQLAAMRGVLSRGEDPRCVGGELGPLASSCPPPAQVPTDSESAPQGYGPDGEEIRGGGLSYTVSAGGEAVDWTPWTIWQGSRPRYGGPSRPEVAEAAGAFVVASGKNPRRYATAGRQAVLDLGGGQACAPEVVLPDAVWLSVETSGARGTTCDRLARYGWDGTLLGSWTVAVKALASDGTQVAVSLGERVEVWDAATGAVGWTVSTKLRASSVSGDALVASGYRETELWVRGDAAPRFTSKLPCVVDGHELFCQDERAVEVRSTERPEVVTERLEMARTPGLGGLRVYFGGRVIHVGADRIVRANAPAPDAGSLARWRHPPFDAEREGTRTLRGTVVRRDGTPLPGATVYAARPALLLPREGNDSAPEWLRHIIESETPYGTAHTDAAGRFAIDAPASGLVDLHAGSDRAWGRHLLLPGVEETTIVAGGGAWEWTQVVDAAGRPVAGALVVVHEVAAHTDANGRVFAPRAYPRVAVHGTTRSNVVAPGYRDAWPVDVRLQLSDAKRPECRLLWGDGTPHEAAPEPFPCDETGARVPHALSERIKLKRCTDTGCDLVVPNLVEVELPVSRAGGGHIALVGEDGTSRRKEARVLEDVPSGRYRAFVAPLARGSGRGQFTSFPQWIWDLSLEVGHGDLVAKAGQPVARPFASIRVVDPLRRPIGGIPISARDPLLGTWGIVYAGTDGVAEVPSDFEGRVAMKLVAQRMSSADDYGAPEIPPGELRLPDVPPGYDDAARPALVPRKLTTRPASWWAANPTAELLIGSWTLPDGGAPIAITPGMFGETPFDVVDATPGTAVIRLGGRSAADPGIAQQVRASAFVAQVVKPPAAGASRETYVEIWFADPDTLLLRERGQREVVEVRVRAR